MSVKLTRYQVAARYSRDPRSIDRWCRESKLGFPQPIMVGRFPMWNLDELETWERSLPRRQYPAAVEEGVAL
jgi:predicted DNA-binding transcriptional regulator AlpA